MFDSAKKSYLKRIEELKLLLEQQKRENADMETELDRFRAQEQIRQKSFQEIKLAMEVKLEEIDRRHREFEQEKERDERRMEEKKAQLHQRLKEEADSARDAIKREAEEEKKRTREILQNQVRSFHQAYSQYLADIQSRLEQLTETSIHVSDCFLGLNHANMQKMFEDEMGRPSAGKVDKTSSAESAPTSEAVSTPARTKDHYEQIGSDKTTDLPRSKESLLIHGEAGNERVEYVINLLGINKENDITSTVDAIMKEITA